MRVFDSLFGIGGAVLLFISGLLYWWHGYHSAILVLWLLAIVSVGVYFFRKERGERKKDESSCFDRYDIVIAVLLTVVVGVLYFSVGPEYPKFLKYDDIEGTVKSVIFSRDGFDIFKPSDYSFLPAPVYSISGHFISLFGAIDVFFVRLFHILLTVLVVSLSYFLFRKVFFRQVSCCCGGAAFCGFAFFVCTQSFSYFDSRRSVDTGCGTAVLLTQFAAQLSDVCVYRGCRRRLRLGGVQSRENYHYQLARVTRGNRDTVKIQSA